MLLTVRNINYKMEGTVMKKLGRPRKGNPRKYKMIAVPEEIHEMFAKKCKEANISMVDAATILITKM